LADTFSRPLTLRSYGYDLLRWFRFIAAIGVAFDEASRTDSSDFVRWLAVSGKTGGSRRPRAQWLRGRLNRETGKLLPHDSEFDPPTMAHSRIVLHEFYGFLLARLPTRAFSHTYRLRYGAEGRQMPGRPESPSNGIGPGLGPEADFANFLHAVRTVKGFTIEQLADQLNLSAATVGGWETGQSLPVREDYVRSLAEVLQVDVEELLALWRPAIQHYQWRTTVFLAPPPQSLPPGEAQFGSPPSTSDTPRRLRPRPSDDPFSEMVGTPPPSQPSPPLGSGQRTTLPASQREARRKRHSASDLVGPSAVNEAIARAISPGRLLWNPPEAMPFAKPTRVEVRVAVSTDLDDELKQGLRGPGTPQLEDLPVSPFMGVYVRGAGFEVAPLSETDQAVGPDGYATWEFDVRPTARGLLTLQLCVSLRIPLPGRPDEKQSIPVFERTVLVHVSAPALAVQFAGKNWQWLVGTIAGLGAVIAAWKGLF
jgi:transcriptional regulator with XRE-family HTH domain